MKRTQAKIFAEILEICKQPATKYKVLRKVYVLCCIGNNYLRSMMSAGLLNNKSSMSSYLTTTKVHVFLEKWNELDKLLNNKWGILG
jgi:predicted transcriptional regulator